jgi:hypothetical protein
MGFDLLRPLLRKSATPMILASIDSNFLYNFPIVLSPLPHP